MKKVRKKPKIQYLWQAAHKEERVVVHQLVCDKLPQRTQQHHRTPHLVCWKTKTISNIH